MGDGASKVGKGGSDGGASEALLLGHSSKRIEVFVLGSRICLSAGMLFLLPRGELREGLVFCGARVGVRTGLVGRDDGVPSILELSESLRRR